MAMVRAGRTSPQPARFKQAGPERKRRMTQAPGFFASRCKARRAAEKSPGAVIAGQKSRREPLPAQIRPRARPRCRLERGGIWRGGAGRARTAIWAGHCLCGKHRCGPGRKGRRAGLEGSRAWSANGKKKQAAGFREDPLRGQRISIRSRRGPEAFASWCGDLYRRASRFRRLKRGALGIRVLPSVTAARAGKIEGCFCGWLKRACAWVRGSCPGCDEIPKV